MNDAGVITLKVKLVGGPGDGKEVVAPSSDCLLIPALPAQKATWCGEGDFLDETVQFETHKYYRLVDGNYHYAGLYVPPPYAPPPPKPSWFKRLLNWWST